MLKGTAGQVSGRKGEACDGLSGGLPRGFGGVRDEVNVHVNGFPRGMFSGVEGEAAYFPRNKSRRCPGV